MEWYWRLQDMPELQGLKAPVQRAQWSKALAAGRTRGRAFAFVASYGLLVVAGKLVAERFHFNGIESFCAVAIALIIVPLVFEFSYRQPRARQWLREHPSSSDS